MGFSFLPRYFRGRLGPGKGNFAAFSRLVSGIENGNFIEKIVQKIVSVGWTWLGEVGIHPPKALPVAFVLEPLKLPRE
jgi:hypothetical protein